MIKNIIKKNIKFYSKLALLIGAFIAFICSFGVSTFAYSENDDGNLISDNLIDNSISVFEMGAVSYNVGRTYQQNKVSINTRIRTIDLIEVDNTKTYSLSVPSPYLVIVQCYENGLNVNSTGTQFNQALSSLIFTGVSQVAIIVRRIDNGNFTSASDIQNVKLMFNEGSTPMKYEPYGSIYYSQNNLDNSYNNGYENGYIDATSNIVNSLQFFNALELYYDNAILFISSDGGNTWSNTSGQNYEITYNSSVGSLVLNRATPWDSTALYYLDVNFKSPININTLRIPSSNHPQTLQQVVVGDSVFSFTYDVIDGLGYMCTRNMLSGLTSSLRFYFGVNGYTNANLRSFDIYIDGFIGGMDSYENGFNDGQASLQPTISSLQANIQVLKNQVNSLSNQLQQGTNSWTSLFFAMADTPFKTASNFLGFEIFGINLFNALIGIITILAIFWVFKRLIK